MASHKRRKAADRRSGSAVTVTKTATRGVAPAGAASRPDTAAPTAVMEKPGARTAAAGPVRRAPVARPGPRGRAAQMRRRRQRTIGGAIAAVVVVAGLGLLLWSHVASGTSGSARKPAATTGAQATTTTAATASTGTAVGGTQAGACGTDAKTGLNGTPASAGGPPPVSGELKSLGQCLQYIDFKVGNGAAVKAGDTVTVNYTGWLTDGTKFDSSLNAGRTPFQVQNVGQASVISGWNMGLIGMKVGGARRLIIPAALAYGAQGSPPTIPPNATLIFDISVVSIP